tara:strand:- start:333 stop:548 length:216 start_codon:yes stop_codon:yes gene_type:complete
LLRFFFFLDDDEVKNNASFLSSSEDEEDDDDDDESSSLVLPLRFDFVFRVPSPPFTMMIGGRDGCGYGEGN